MCTVLLPPGVKPIAVKYIISCHVFTYSCVVEASWNVMAQAQKPDFFFRRNGRVHLNQRGASVQSTTGSRGMRISGSNAGYTMFRGSVKGTGYPLHSPVFPLTSPPVRHRVPSHFNRSVHPCPLRRFLYICRNCSQYCTARR